MKHIAFGGGPFQLGLFAAVPIRSPQPQGVMEVPYPTMLFNVYNRYLPPYWLPGPPEQTGNRTPIRPRGEIWRGP